MGDFSPIPGSRAGNVVQFRTIAGNTTGLSSSGTMNRAEIFSAAGIVSMGFTSTAAGGNVLVFSASSGTSNNLVALGNTFGATSSTTVTLTNLSVSGTGNISVGFSTTAAGAGVMMISGSSGTSNNLVALGVNTVGATSSTTATLTNLSVSGAGNISVGFSTTAAGAGVMVISGAGGGGSSLSYFEPVEFLGGTTTTSLPNGATMFMAPMTVPQALVINQLQLLGTFTLGLMVSASSSKSVSASASMSSGMSVVIYSAMGGTSSDSYTSFTSTHVSFSISQTLNGSSSSVTNAVSLSFPFGSTTSSTVISTTTTSSSQVAIAASTNYSSWREIDIPLAATLQPGNYIIGVQGNTVSAGASAMSWSASVGGMTQATIAIGAMGVTQANFFNGLGMLSTSATSTVPTSFNFQSLTTTASKFRVYWQMGNI